jgi:hypothetical protein
MTGNAGFPISVPGATTVPTAGLYGTMPHTTVPFSNSTI